jgi:hypothetical protein
MGRVLPLYRALETSLSLTPIDQRRFCRPRDHKQDVENSLSTCTAPWMTVRRSIALRASLPLPQDPHGQRLALHHAQEISLSLHPSNLKVYPLSVSFAQVDADDRYLIDPRIFRRKLVPMIAKRFEQTVEIY